jgi:acetyltransferase-like isoleucine patch superfamily enzyme
VNIAGNVMIGDEVFVGIGSNVIQGISIGKSTCIGAGSNVVCNIESNRLAFGNPARIQKTYD